MRSIYIPVTIQQVQNPTYDGTSLVRVQGVVASHGFVPTPFLQNSGLTYENWQQVHGSGLVSGILYDSHMSTVNHTQNLSFNAGFHINDTCSQVSTLILLLGASQNAKQEITLEGECRRGSENLAHLILHRVILGQDVKDGSRYNATTHNYQRYMDQMVD